MDGVQGSPSSEWDVGWPLMVSDCKRANSGDETRLFSTPNRTATHYFSSEASSRAVVDTAGTSVGRARMVDWSS